MNTWKGVAHARTGATLLSWRWSAHSCLCVMDRDISQTFHVGCHGVSESQYWHGWMCETWLTTLFLDTEGLIFGLTPSAGARVHGYKYMPPQRTGVSVALARMPTKADSSWREGPATIKEMCWRIALNVCVLMCWEPTQFTAGGQTAPDNDKIARVSCQTLTVYGIY